MCSQKTNRPPTLRLRWKWPIDQVMPRIAMRSLRARFHRETAGQDLIEYALLAGTIAAGVALGISLLGTAIQERYAAIGAQMESGAPAAAGGGPSPAGGGGDAAAASAGSGGGDGGGGTPSGNNGNHAGGGNNGNGRGNGS